MPAEESHLSVEEELKRYGKDLEYLDEHRQELLERYPERWVAVYNLRVVGAAKDLRRLIGKLEKQGIPPGEVYREFLTRNEPLLILLSRSA